MKFNENILLCWCQVELTLNAPLMKETLFYLLAHKTFLGVIEF